MSEVSWRTQNKFQLNTDDEIVFNYTIVGCSLNSGAAARTLDWRGTNTVTGSICFFVRRQKTMRKETQLSSDLLTSSAINTWTLSLSKMLQIVSRSSMETKTNKNPKTKPTPKLQRTLEASDVLGYLLLSVVRLRSTSAVFVLWANVESIFLPFTDSIRCYYLPKWL